jgi:hypothetical protein
MRSFVKRLFLVILVAFSPTASSVESKGTDGAVVKTISGLVKGEIEKGVFVFRGIRYAAPPVGSLRFRSPVRPIAWADVRPALDLPFFPFPQYAHCCPGIPRRYSPLSRLFRMPALNGMILSMDKRFNPANIWSYDALSMQSLVPSQE